MDAIYKSTRTAYSNPTISFHQQKADINPSAKTESEKLHTSAMIGIVIHFNQFANIPEGKRYFSYA